MAKGATKLSEGELIEEITRRLGIQGHDISRATVSKVVKALKEEAIDCLANGYKVGLNGLVTITPSAVKGRKKGTEVRNPFDGTTKKLKSDEPDKFKVKAKASTAILSGFPSIKSKDGQALHKQLTPARKK